jgi:hypothetical protein
MEIEGYTKFITGHVAQTFVKKDGEYVCTGQSFTASDDTTYEDDDGEVIDEFDIDEIVADEVYFPMNMEQPDADKN